MELSYLFLLITFILFLLKLIHVNYPYKSKRRQNQPPKLPPGPRKLPIIGSMHHLLGSPPHRSLARLAKSYGPLMHLQLGEISTYVISSSEIAQEILKTHDVIFATRPHLIAIDILAYGSTDIAFSPYGEYWRQLRKICVVELLSAKRVRSFQRIREEETFNLMCSISSSPALINLGDRLPLLTNDITARAAFGAKCEEQRAFSSAVKEVVRLAGVFNLADFFPSSKLVPAISRIKPILESLRHEIDKILDNIIKQHVKNNTTPTTNTSNGDHEEEDLLGVLLRLQKSGSLNFSFTIDNIKAVISDIFTGGTDTSAVTMEWVMTELIRCPRAMTRVQEELRKVLRGKDRVTEADISNLNYLKLVIKETLRLHPPIPLLLPRVCTQTCEVQGYEIPKNSRILVNAWAIGRDPRFWDDAESFKPERFEGSSVDFKGTNFEYIPFGAGRRICPGMLLGIANMELPLAQLLYYFDWELPHHMKPSDLDMAESVGAMVAKTSKLQLRAIPRIPLPVC